MGLVCVQKMASNLSAASANSERGLVVSQRFLWLLKKLTELSSLNISTLAGSSGATPPLGDAKASSAPAFTKTS